MSGKKKRNIGGTVTVGDVALTWSIRSEPQWNTTAGDIGLRLSVTAAEGRHRELILQYPFVKRQKGASRFPDKPRVDPIHLAADIGLAMEAGWNPKSRGRPFELILDEQDVAGRDGA
jgi:hypothetical protein